MTKAGPLAGIRIIEVESIGPGPYAAMQLADLGANVLTVARPTAGTRRANAVLYRGRAGSVALDLKNAEHREQFLRLVAQADGLIEGYRPGVMERLGLGPEPCLARNPKLVFGRITGWGRSGPLAMSAGHDINYIALTGALHACGTAESGPIPPLNLVGDFGGGGLMLAFGMLAALLEARASGRGQVVDTAMIDGAASLMAMTYGMRAVGRWSDSRANNIFDGSAYYYCCYACADGRWVAVGAIEPEFRKVLFAKLGLAEHTARLMAADDADPDVRAELSAIFKSQSRDEWAAVFEGSDACVSPVLSIDEAPLHPHNQARGSVQRVGAAIQPMPAPRFSRTQAPELETGARADLMRDWQL